MKIALAQINSTIGDFEGIFKKAVSFVEEAKRQKVDLIAFPELTTTGYPPRDLVEIPGFVDHNLGLLDEIAALSQDLSIIVGYVGHNTHGQGKSLRNAAALCSEGRVVERYAKNLLPTYDVFDEARYFEPGTTAGVWSLEDPEGTKTLKTKLGISICEDAWNDRLFWQKRLYERDPIEEQVQKGARVLLNISSSPFALGKNRFRIAMLSAQALKHKLPLLYVNLVGGNDELVFDGRSLVFNDRGELVSQGRAYEEDLVIVDLATLSGKTHAMKINDDMEDVESIYRTLVLGVRDYVKKCGFKKVILGLSGGIDSALTAVIAVEALGAENVLGVSMPSPYSSEGSVEDSKKLAKNLGLRLESYPIHPVYEACRHLFSRDEETLPDLADENVQARIRGNILMTLSNRYGYLVLSTGNKSELAVGYCTLYGDMSGGLAVISDLPKTTVYEVARWIQKTRPMIPPNIFTKPPSAELRPNQTDQDTLPPYDILDAILKAAIEEYKSEDEIIRLGFDPKTVRRVLNLVHNNEYKRRQAAPGIKITSKAFGMGRRYPIAKKF